MALYILNHTSRRARPNAENQSHTGRHIGLHTLKGGKEKCDTNAAGNPKLFLSLAVYLRQEPSHAATEPQTITDFDCFDKIIGSITSRTDDKTPGHLISTGNGKRMRFGPHAFVTKHRKLARLKLVHCPFGAECDVNTAFKWRCPLDLNQTCWNQFTQQRLAPCDYSND
jgi:hypothetical protein